MPTLLQEFAARRSVGHSCRFNQLRYTLRHDSHHQGRKSKGRDDILARGWFETQGGMEMVIST